MAQVTQRFDKNPMHRGRGEGPFGDPPHNYEVREVEPNTHDELHRRAGSVRQARYGQAPGFAGPGASKWLVDRQALNLTGAAFTLGFRVRVGAIQAASGTTPILLAQKQDNALGALTLNRLYIWLDKTAGTYSIKANIYDNAGSAGLTTLTVATGVTPGANLPIMLYTDAGIAAATNVTLDVNGNTDTGALAAGTYTMSDCVLHILPDTAADGDLTVVDPVNLFGSDVSTDGVTDVSSRTPTTPPTIQINCDSAAPISPGTGTGDVLPYPSAPLIDNGELRYSGYSGALRVPYRPVFDQFFSSDISSVGSKVFAIKVRHTPAFHSGDQTTTLAEFPGFFTLALDTSRNPVFTYSDQAAWTTTGLSVGVGTEQTFWIGCDGTNLFAYDDSGNSDTEPLTGALPALDYERIPDLIIGAPEDPAGAQNYHGSVAEFKLFNYAATSDDGVPIFDLDLSGTEPRDASKYRLPVSAEPHKEVDDYALIAPGPIDDEAHAAVLSGEVVVGTGTVDSTSDTYLRGEDGGFSSAATSARFGDRVAVCEPGGALAVVDTERDQVRPLGIPQIQAEVTTRTLGTGALDGAYSYGARFISGDGTYGPIRRLKPVKAVEGASVLLGSSGGEGSENNTELGESYGQTNSGYENYFEWDGGALTADSDEKGYSVETYLRFPEFEGLEEDIFDRGVTLESGNSAETAWPHFEAGIPVDFTSNFTIQTAFTFDDTLNSTAGDDIQCIHAIGHNDPDPWTRAYMLCLYKDASGWGGGSYRLAAFRANGRRDLTYQGTVVDDSGIWTNGKRYNIISVRRGNALEIHVHNQTDDLWYHYTTRAAAASSALQMSSFWDGKNNYGHKNKATYLHYGAPAHREEGGSSGSMMEQVDRISTAGDFNASGTLWVNPLSAGSVYFHGRAWSLALSKAQVIYDTEKRYAAQSGGPLSNGLLSDVAFISDDPSVQPDRFWDRAKTVYWKFYAEDGTTGKVSNPDEASTDQSFTGNETVMHGAYMTDDAEADYRNAEYQLYASSIGEGSIVLGTPEQTYVLASEVWDPNNSTVSQLQGFDPTNFNWYTTSVVFETAVSGTEYDLTILDFAVNGVEQNARSLSGPSTLTLTKANFRVYLGGFDGLTNAEDVHVGEFRLWASNRYDDSSEEYDYLQVRVPEGQYSDLYLYATFQPSDENDPVDGEFEQRGSITGVWLKSPSSGSWDGDNDAEIIDGRDLGGEVTNPPPAVSFPAAPYPHITAIEILRSGGITIADSEDEAEVARALLAAEGAPLRSLARIPIGTSSYIDILPDEGLGKEVVEGSGFAPGRVQGVFLWANRLGVFRDGVIQMAEPGPFGWESFLSTNQITVDNTGTSDITAAAQFAGSLAVFGSDWATILNGTPEDHRPYYLGGAGAQSARAVAVYGGQLFALSDNTLWRISPPSGLSAPEAVDFGGPVQDLLPSAGRLAVSAKKSSLYVIDESDGECLRFHFPTQRWFIEDRDALSVGDTDSGFTVVHTTSSGAYSVENTSVAGDDINAGTTGDASGTIATSSTISLTPDPDVPAGTRVLVEDSSGNEALTRVVSWAADVLTVTTGDLSGLNTEACTVHFGVGDSGLVVDSGQYANPTGYEHEVLKLNTGVISGDGWEAALEGSASPGSRTASSSVAYDALGTDSDEEHQGGSRGRWIRTRVRNRHSELGKLDRLELTGELEQ